MAGAAAVDGLSAALGRTGGTTGGEALAGALEGLRDLPTLSGEISFSAGLHTATRRQLRLVEVRGARPRFAGLVRTRVAP